MTTTTPDLLNLYNDKEFEKIEAILDSAEYTREEKIAMITNKKYLFSRLMYAYARIYFEPIPIELSIKVLRIFGENLGNYVDELKNIVTMNYEDENEKLLRVIVEELSDFQFIDVLTSLLVHSLFRNSSVAIVNVLLSSESVKQNILMQKSIEYEYYSNTTERTICISLCSSNEIIAENIAANTDSVFYNHATLLEIALHKHVRLDVIRALVRVGGKKLLLLSERSLIQGAILENSYYNKDETVEIVKLFLKVGGKDLVMKEKSWHEHDAHACLNILEYLCERREYLFSNIGPKRVAKVMTMLLDTGGKDLVMKKKKKGQSILHDFKYFNHYPFISVVERIKEIGGVDLLSITDNNGDTVLHTLAKYYPQKKFNAVVNLKWWEILACNRDLVMLQNKDGKTALHVACENSEVNAIKVLVEKGGKDLVWKRDNEMNTALHLLPFRVSRGKDSNNFQALKHILEAGGMELLHSLNNREKKPMSPFFIDALEFKFDEKRIRAKIDALLEEAKLKEWCENSLKAIQEKCELDRKAKLNLEKKLQAVQKKNSKLEWKWINRKKMQRSEKELKEAVHSLKNKLKAQKKDNDALNDTIKEFQKEKESERMNYMTKADIDNQLKDEIKQLRDLQQSLQSKIQEQQVVIENLQDERKQADLEFEIVKTMHEENKNAYEKSLVEVSNLKEVERTQQDDIRDQKEMIQNLQNELGQKDEEYTLRLRKLEEENQLKDEEYTLRLRKLEEENQLLRDFNDKEEVPHTDKPSSIQEESQRLIEEVKANIDEESSIENRVRSLEEENKTLKDAVKEQKQIATEKQNENKTLKDENERLIDKMAMSSLKRSRGVESEEIDCIEEDEDDIFCPPTKRGKLTPTSPETKSSENTRTYQIASLESEIEELINDLEYEKTSHTKTLKRLKEARKSSKKN